MINVQISMDEELLQAIDNAGKPLGLKRSQIVRAALRGWLQKQSVESFEQQWIAAIQITPDDPKRAELWRGALDWSKK